MSDHVGSGSLKQGSRLTWVGVRPLHHLLGKLSLEGLFGWSSPHLFNRFDLVSEDGGVVALKALFGEGGEVVGVPVLERAPHAPHDLLAVRVAVNDHESPSSVALLQVRE